MVTAVAKQSNQRHFIFVTLWQWDLWKTFSILDCGVLTWNLLISSSLDTKVIFFKRDGAGAAFIDWGVIQFESWVCLVSEVRTTTEWARAHPASFLQDHHLFQTALLTPLTPSAEPWLLWGQPIIAEGQINLHSYFQPILCFSK